MKNFNCILKLTDKAYQRGKVDKLVGNTTLASFIPLISNTDLDANPRRAKNNSVTKDILETLRENPELFTFMSKGVLIAASQIEELERNRLRIEIADSSKEGILDGGHNTFAIGCEILRLVGYERYDRIKGWDELKEIWGEHEALIEKNKSNVPLIKVPIEIIHPSDKDTGLDDFNDSVLAISAARNNNAQLKETAKAHKAGLYDIIKQSMDQSLVDEVEWQENDGGRIKTADIVALSLIPLSVLPAEKYPVAKIIRDNPAMISSSKGACVKYYNDFMNADGITQRVDNNVTVELKDPLVRSALALMKDIPKLYDEIYKLLPDAYNKASPGFGRISSVRIYDPVKWKDDKKSYMRNPAKTKFYQYDVLTQYPDGFLYPLVVSLSKIITVDGDTVKWTCDPMQFVRDNLEFVFKTGYQSIIKAQNYDPGKVTKETGAYNLVAQIYMIKTQQLQN